MNIRPFQPYLFRQDLENVTSPPFDVITKEQEAILKENQYNITHLTLPEAGNPDNSRRVLNKWIGEGTLVKGEENSLIIITQDFRGNGKDFCRIGLIAPVETSPSSGIIMPHEDTFEWAVNERQNLMYRAGCQLEPIFLAIKGVSFERILKSAIKDLLPVRTFEEPTGVINKFFMVSDSSSVNSIVKAISREKAIVADGHHRLKAIQKIFSESGSNQNEFWKYSLAYVTSLQQESLMISGIHRLVSTEYSFGNYRDLLKQYFDFEQAGSTNNLDKITVYDGSYYALTPNDRAFESIGEYGNFRLLSDPSLVNLLIFEKIMGMAIHDIARKIGYTQNVPFAVEEVDKGRCGFAILMPEWDKSTFLSMAEKGRIMPQKSTYFYPKIPSGIAVYCDEID